MWKLLENYSRKLFRQLTFNSNFAKYFAVWRKNLNAIQDFVTGSCHDLVKRVSIIFRRKKYIQYLDEFCILTKTNFTLMETNNWKISNISQKIMRQSYALNLLTFWYSFSNVKDFHMWITELVNTYIPKQFHHILSFLQLPKERSYELDKVLHDRELLHRKKNLEEVAVPRETF